MHARTYKYVQMSPFKIFLYSFSITHSQFRYFAYKLKTFLYSITTHSSKNYYSKHHFFFSMMTVKWRLKGVPRIDILPLNQQKDIRNKDVELVHEQNYFFEFYLQYVSFHTYQVLITISIFSPSHNDMHVSIFIRWYNWKYNFFLHFFLICLYIK